MTLSIEEIELHLEENPHDLTVWREWLSYTHRYDLSQDRYLEYIKSLDVYFDDKFGDESWELLGMKNLDLFRGVYAPNLEFIKLHILKDGILRGIDDLIAPNLNELEITRSRLTEISHSYSPLEEDISTYKVDSIILPHITALSLIDMSIYPLIQVPNLKYLTIEHFPVADYTDIYNLKELETLSIWGQPKDSPPPKLEFLPKLRSITVNPKYADNLDGMGDSNTLTNIQYYTSGGESKRVIETAIHSLVDKGWYPNLEYPMKGKNKQLAKKLI